MAREEQLNEYLKERNIPVDSLEANSIIEGVEWADKHPKKGLVSLDRIVEYLNGELYTSCDYFGNVQTASRDCINKKEFIEKLCKAMEE